MSTQINSVYLYGVKLQQKSSQGFKVKASQNFTENIYSNYIELYKKPNKSMISTLTLVEFD